MAALMLFLASFAYLARSRVLEDRPLASASATTQRAAQVWDTSQYAAIVKQHGGVVSDARAQDVQLIGKRIAAAVDDRLQANFRFELLADEIRPAIYPFGDGRVLITLGLARLTQFDSEFAAALCGGMERIVRSRGADSGTPFGALSATWMQRAGFDPRDLDVVRQRMAARDRRTES